MLPAKSQAVAERMLRTPGECCFIYQQDEVLALPLQLKDDLAVLQTALYIKKAGIKMGKLIGSELVPGHELALSTHLHSNTPCLDADITAALQYLRRQDFAVTGNRKGWHLVRYCGLGLGWVKLLHNRINNYYPKDWRILMQQ
jgi:NOL1/NOP2/fmu family ribosome biogenesis protein